VIFFHNKKTIVALDARPVFVYWLLRVPLAERHLTNAIKKVHLEKNPLEKLFHRRFLKTYSEVPPVFSNSPCRETPKFAIKKYVVDAFGMF
jgi:hypothetical protein